MLVAELITQALYLSGKVTIEFDDAAPADTPTALFWLNMLLSTTSALGRENPYLTEYNFTAVQDVPEYFIPGLAEIKTITYTIQNVRWPVEVQYIDKFMGNARVNGINALIYSCYAQRVPNGSLLRFYMNTSLPVPVKIMGKFGIDSVTLDTDLSGYDLYFINYLIHLLAVQLCSVFFLTPRKTVLTELHNLKVLMHTVNADDTAYQPINLFNTSGTTKLPTWVSAPFFDGWIP